MLRVVIVVLLLSVAGCTGLLADGDTQTPETSVTPAPVPESRAASASGDITLPRSDGYVDIDRLLDRHDAALANRSFHRAVEREGPHNTRDVWVDREDGVVRVRQTFGPLTRGAVVVNDTEYRPVSDDPDVDYRTTEPDGVPLVDSLTGAAELRRWLTGEDYRRLGTVRRKGRTLAVVGSNDTDVPLTAGDPDQAVAVGSRLYVDSDGVVRAVAHWERRTDGSNVSVQMTVTTGRDDVPIPWWLEDADPYASGSM